jgi:hypothetical protein
MFSGGGLCGLSSRGLTVRLHRLRVRRVLVTNGCHSADLSHAPEHMGGNIGTAGVVTEVFSELFLAPVRSCESRLNRYLRNGGSPNPLTVLSDG